MNYNNKKIVINTLSLYGRMFITMIISFFTSRITLEVLGVEDYGLNNLVGGIVTMFSFLNASMGTSVQRYFSNKIGTNDKEGLRKVFGAGLYIHCIIAFLTYILLEIFALFFIEKLNIPHERMFAAQMVFQISAFSMILNVINVPYAALLRAREEFSKTAIGDVVQSFLRLGLLFCLFHISYDKLILFSALNLIVTCCYVLYIFFLCRKYSESKFAFCKDKLLIKEMLSFTSFVLLGTFASIFRDKGMLIIVNLFFGLRINAAFAVATQVKNIIETFSANFKQSVVPQIMSSFSGNDIERSNKLVFSSSKVSLYLLLCISMPVIYNSDYLLKIWLKTPPEHSASLVVLILINTLLFSMPYFIMQLTSACGKIKRLQILWSIINILAVFFMWLLSFLGFSFNSMLIVVICSSLCYNIINLYCAKREFGFDVSSFIREVYLRSFYVIAMTCLIGYFLELIDLTGIFKLVTETIVLLVTILISGYVLGLNNFERNWIKGLVIAFANKQKRKISR